jgi:hypothetical protein
MSDEDLFRLCDEVQALDGRVTTARLREAAGGGGHNRLKEVVEAWQVRREEAARRGGKGMPESSGQDRDLDSKVPGTGRRRGGNVEAPATAAASPHGDKSAIDPVTLGDVEQAEIAMEAGRVKAVLSGGEATLTETPGEPDVPSSIEQAEAEVAEILAAAAGPEGGDGPPGAAAARRRRHQSHRRQARRACMPMRRFHASRPTSRTCGGKTRCCGTR